jgi:hypothetical protein
MCVCVCVRTHTTCMYACIGIYRRMYACIYIKSGVYIYMVCVCVCVFVYLFIVTGSRVVCA